MTLNYYYYYYFTFRTVRNTLLILIMIWVFNILGSIPMFFLSRLARFWEHGYQRLYCAEYFDTPTIRRAFTLTLFIMFYLLPLTIIGTCYLMMTLSLNGEGRPGSHQQGCAAEASRTRKRKIAKLVMVVVATFALCWLPIHVVHLNNDFGPTEYSYLFYIIKIVAHCMSYANSAINPIIYSFMSNSFRQSFREACCCKTRCTPGITINSNEQEARQIISSSSSQPATAGSQSVENGASLCGMPGIFNDNSGKQPGIKLILGNNNIKDENRSTKYKEVHL